MSIRGKAFAAWVAAAILLAGCWTLLSRSHATSYFYVLLGLAVAVGLLAYVTGLRCPNCNGRAFSRRWLVVLYIPATCATCDREFSD